MAQLKTFLAQNEFISNSTAIRPPAVEEVVASRPDASTDPAAIDSCQEPVVADLTDCIGEIFFYARKLMKDAPGFVLDEARFLADIDEEPLFLREDGYLQRREA